MLGMPGTRPLGGLVGCCSAELRGVLTLFFGNLS